MDKNLCFLIANFGGPRTLGEIEPFLKELLTDGDVIRSRLPKWIQDFLFRRVAKKRSVSIAKDYQLIGGKSPIFEETEALAKIVEQKSEIKVVTFHRYLPSTHRQFIESLKLLDCDEIRVFPMFPQFTYATTGSMARWFDKHLPREIVLKMRWVKSYPAHPGFVKAEQNLIRQTLKKHELKEEESILLFSAHGVPKSFIANGDIYLDECIASYEKVKEGFSDCLCRLSFQSQFGKEEWIRPYTNEVCEEILSWGRGRKNVIFVPITFTSDHIETLFEIEHLYMPLIKERGLEAFRVPALTFDPIWIESIVELLKTESFCNTQMLIRN